MKTPDHQIHMHGRETARGVLIMIKIITGKIKE